MPTNSFSAQGCHGDSNIDNGAICGHQNGDIISERLSTPKPNTDYSAGSPLSYEDSFTWLEQERPLAYRTRSTRTSSKSHPTVVEIMGRDTTCAPTAIVDFDCCLAPMKKRKKASLPFSFSNPSIKRQLDMSCSFLDNDKALPNSTITPTYSAITQSEQSEVGTSIFEKTTRTFPDALKRVFDCCDTSAANDFCNLIELMAAGKFPFENISFTLLLHTARFYSKTSSTQMWYSEQVLKFFKVGYRLMGERFLVFMGGDKSSGDVLSGKSEKGRYIPGESSLNFAVPSVSVIRNFNEQQFPKAVHPGIIESMLRLKAGEDKDFIISVDGKKVSPGVNRDGGDINLFGHEPGPSFTEQQSRLADEKLSVQTLIELVQPFNTEPLYSIPSQINEAVVGSVRQQITILGHRIKESREMKLKQEFALNRLEKDPSRYEYAISAVKAKITIIKAFIKDALDTIGDLCHAASQLSGCNDYVSTDEVDSQMQENLIKLKAPEDLPEAYSKDRSFIQQRSPEWHESRSQFKVTGSTIYNALGMRSLQEQKKHFRQYVLHKASDVPDDVQERMDYGVKNEINAAATLAGCIIPSLYPDMALVEEGSYTVMASSGDPLMLVSPDGSLRPKDAMLSNNDIPNASYGVEIKCPYPSPHKVTVHYTVPEYYVPQLLAEMATLRVDSLLYCAYSMESTTVHLVTFDVELWESIVQESENLYLSHKPKVPIRISDFAKATKEKLKTFVHRNATFIGEFPSKHLLDTRNSTNTIHADNSPYIVSTNTSQLNHITGANLVSFLSQVNTCLEKGFEISRLHASEVLVWLLQDTDREWHAEKPHSVPIAYALKGYSLNCDTMRSMCDFVLAACRSHNIRVVASCFDGQWAKLCNRSRTGKPLTLLQLQRDHWQSCQKTPLPVQLKTLSECKNIGVLAGVNWNKLLPLLGTIAPTNPVTDNQSDMPTIRQGPGDIAHGVESIDQVDERVDVDIEDRNAYENAPGEFPDKVQEIGYLPPEVMEDLMGTQRDDILGDLRTCINRPAENCATVIPEIFLTTDVMVSIVKELVKAKPEAWSGKSYTDLLEVLSSINLLGKLTVKELDIIIKGTEFEQAQGELVIRKSWTKTMKVNALSKLFGDGTQLPVTIKRKFSKKAQAVDINTPLSKLAASAVAKLKKPLITAAYACATYDKALNEWYESNPFGTNAHLHPIGVFHTWFSQPDTQVGSSDLILNCLDSDHLLVNCRVKVCKDGFNGLSKKAWHSVSEYDERVISSSLTVDLIDKQRNAYAQRTFSVEVQRVMEHLGFTKEADFCQLMREWYEAEDNRGIPAGERIKRRLSLARYLLHDVNFGAFPPYGSHIKGIPNVMYEGLLQSIDAHIAMYAMTRHNSYNQRSLSTLESETFFGTLSEMTLSHSGCPKAVHIPRMLAIITEIMHYRQDPDNRDFQLRTSKRAVYPTHKCDRRKMEDEHQTENADNDDSTTNIKHIVIRNHFFDTPPEATGKVPRRKSSDIGHLFQPCRGAQPVRYHHRTNEERILPEKRVQLNNS